MTKIGRNKPCPCGSGKKYKHCHGSLAGRALLPDVDAAFEAKLKEIDAENAQRQKQQGYGRPIISAEFHDQRIVAVGNRIFHSKNWKTFHDFLREYIFMVLGKEWTDKQRDTPAKDRHQIVRWHDQAMSDARQTAVEKHGVFSGVMTGAQRAFLNLAYNLYLIAHHSEPKRAEATLHSFVHRLKSARTDDFIGKLFETYASAAMLKAGFGIEYENEKDGSDSHVEFVATYPETGRKFSVEVKARNRTIGIDGPMDDVKRLRVGQKLVKALRKSAAHERIVFVEVNIPDVVDGDFSGTWVESALGQIKESEDYLDSSGAPYPSSYVIVTNHAFHNNLEAADIGLQAVADGYRIDSFGPGASVNGFAAYLENFQRHKEILALFDSLKEHNNIPSTFDGEIPEFAFGEDEGYPRLRIGQEYLIPDDKGELVPGVLGQALVSEHSQKATGIYRLQDGRHVMVSHELTDRELTAWRRHPETFFGRVEEKHAQPENWLELAEFFYRTYNDTDKDRLLEFMKGAHDFDGLAAMSQKDLAIIYCERVALSAWIKNPVGTATTG